MFRQTFNGPSKPRVLPIRNDITCGLQDEHPRGVAWVRNDQVRTASHQVSVQYNIQIDRSSIPADLALAAKLLLDSLQPTEHLARGCVRSKRGDRVEKRRLPTRPANRRGGKQSAGSKVVDLRML